jgi:hypothetical protein
LKTQAGQDKTSLDHGLAVCAGMGLPFSFFTAGVGLLKKGRGFLEGAFDFL